MWRCPINPPMGGRFYSQDQTTPMVVFHPQKQTRPSWLLHVKQTHPRCYEGGGGEEMEVVTVGWRRWRVEESGVGDRVDPLRRTTFGVRRKNPPENFSGSGVVMAGGGWRLPE
ncbi:hypothetical protein Tco_0930431 [Tanacetum coccineum]